jgi:hypothetical protein
MMAMSKPTVANRNWRCNTTILECNAGTSGGLWVSMMCAVPDQ